MTKSSHSPEFLIVGASGFLGNALYRESINRGFATIGTRYSRNENEQLCYFDLKDTASHREFIKSLQFEEQRVAVICSSLCSIDECKKNPLLSHEVNVGGTINIIQELRESGFRVVFISTDNVFDGLTGNYEENSARKPINLYGLQKKQIEDLLLLEKEKSLIVRLSKMISYEMHPKNLFFEWVKALRNKKDIVCIKDQIFSPTSIEEAARAIIYLAHVGASGVYHVVGAACERFGLARYFFERYLRYCAAESNVIERDVSDFGFVDARPLNTSLMNTKITNEFHLSFESAEKVAEKFIENLMESNKI